MKFYDNMGQPMTLIDGCWVSCDCDPETATANRQQDATIQLNVDIGPYTEQMERVREALAPTADELRARMDAALKFNGKSWVADGSIPTRDVGDLLTGIDDDCGAAIERAAQRFLPRPEAKDVRRELVRKIGDKVVANDAKVKR